MQARFVDLASISPARLDPRQTRPRAWLPNNNSGTWLRLTLLRLRTVRPTLNITRGRAGDGIIVEVHYPGWAKVRTARNLCNGTRRDEMESFPMTRIPVSGDRDAPRQPQLCTGRAGPGRTDSDWIGLDWIGLDWIGQMWVGELPGAVGT
jgi:hypothetical protein